LLNQETPQIAVNEQNAVLRTAREIGLFTPKNLGVIKIEKFNINNVITNK